MNPFQSAGPANPVDEVLAAISGVTLSDGPAKPQVYLFDGVFASQDVIFEVLTFACSRCGTASTTRTLRGGHSRPLWLLGEERRRRLNQVCMCVCTCVC